MIALPHASLPQPTKPSAAVRLLARPEDQAWDGASPAFASILRAIAGGERRIEIHLYVWRCDRIGNAFGKALLEAADRGVEIVIRKDRGAILFETQEDNGQPFLPLDLPFGKRLLYRLIGCTLPNSAVPLVFDPALGEAVLAHPGISVQWVAPTHVKYYLIDGKVLFIGSLNLEDRHLGYHDALVEIRDANLIADFLDARGGEGKGAFLFNLPMENNFPIVDRMLEWIAEAVSEIHLEMAYLGDPAITEALVEAARRGVRVRILSSENANIGDQLNKHVLGVLLDRAPQIQVALSPKMIHTKLMVVDRRKVTLGSANASVFSLRRAGEANLFLQSEVFAEDVLEIFGLRWNLARPVRCSKDLGPQNRLLAALQQWHQQRASHR